MTTRYVGLLIGLHVVIHIVYKNFYHFLPYKFYFYHFLLQDVLVVIMNTVQWSTGCPKMDYAVCNRGSSVGFSKHSIKAVRLHANIHTPM